MKTFIIIIIIFGGGGLWLYNTSDMVRAIISPIISEPKPSNNNLVNRSSSAPIQNNLSGRKWKEYHKGKVYFLAEYEISATVMSTKNYSSGTYGIIAPVDLALGWGKMSERSVYSQLSISQSNRWYHYRWQNRPPINPIDIAISSANVHIIPANDHIKQKLKSLKKHQKISIKGYLVHYKETYANGGYWEVKSSMSRSDRGEGACEALYAEQIEIH